MLSSINSRSRGILSQKNTYSIMVGIPVEWGTDCCVHGVPYIKASELQ